MFLVMQYCRFTKSFGVDTTFWCHQETVKKQKQRSSQFTAMYVLVRMAKLEMDCKFSRSFVVAARENSWDNFFLDLQH